jgi:hypothetical protein
MLGLGQVATDRLPLPHWGNFVGFDEAGHYVVETVEGRRIRVDVAKGEQIPENRRGDQPGKPGKPMP